MEFYDQRTSWACVKKGLSKNELKAMGFGNPKDLYAVFSSPGFQVQDPIGFRHYMFEKLHYESNRPYYNVYPSIIPMLTSLELDIPGSVVKPPQDICNLLLKMPKGHDLLEFEYGGEKHHVQSVFLSFQPVNEDPNVDKLVNGLIVGIDIGETMNMPLDHNTNLQIPIFSIRIFPIDERSIEEAVMALKQHPSSNEGIIVPNDTMLDCVKLAITVCLLDNDPTVLQQQPMSKDINKYKNADDDGKQRLLDKAVRKGKIAYDLGKEIEVAPHVRRPHPALYWTGKGRTIPKVVFRKGAIVHRDKVKSVPSGFDGKE
jgi:hypothetical protein